MEFPVNANWIITFVVNDLTIKLLIINPKFDIWNHIFILFPSKRMTPDPMYSGNLVTFLATPLFLQWLINLESLCCPSLGDCIDLAFLVWNNMYYPCLSQKLDFACLFFCFLLRSRKRSVASRVWSNYTMFNIFKLLLCCLTYIYW